MSWFILEYEYIKWQTKQYFNTVLVHSICFLEHAKTFVFLFVFVFAPEKCFIKSLFFQTCWICWPFSILPLKFKLACNEIITCNKVQHNLALLLTMCSPGHCRCKHAKHSMKIATNLRLWLQPGHSNSKWRGEVLFWSTVFWLDCKIICQKLFPLDVKGKVFT